MNTGAQILKKIEEFNAEDRIGIKLLESSVFLLSGDIDQDNVDECIRWLISENLDRKEKRTLTIYINSTGGDLYYAFALIDIMKHSYHDVRTIGIGAVMSAAFMIFASGTPGERYAGRNASFMSHQYSETFTGKHHDLKATMKEGESYATRMVNLLKEATGLPTAKIKSKLLPASDVYLTAEEALELNIADHIF
jgi:ATP-dependent Clp protease, protease subunit